jgi:hypothetical protein
LNQGLTPSTEQVFLELWGGIAANCSQTERLWASPALSTGWKTYCVPLQPHAFLDQITLRGNSDMSQPTQGYLIVDNLKPVASCP